MKSISECIDEHIRLSKEWLAEGKFNDHYEMVYAQAIKATIELYEKRRAKKEGVEPNDSPRAS